MRSVVRTIVSAVVLGWKGPRYVAQKHLAHELSAGEPEIALIPLLCDKDHDFLDVGANHGVYALHALEHCRTVHAVEAHPDLVRSLRQIFEPDGHVVASALSDHEGTARLSIPRLHGQDVTTRSSLEAGANPGFRAREVDVPITTIDLLDLDRVGVIKIDVEGHELAVLRGAVKTLATGRPACIVECEERHHAGGVSEAFAFFARLGYDAYFLHQGKLHSGADYDVAALQRPEALKAVGGGRCADYVNNFLFVHPDNDAGLARVRQVFG